MKRKEQDVLVKWKDYEGLSTWVSLDGNQELQQEIKETPLFSTSLQEFRFQRNRLQEQP